MRLFSTYNNNNNINNNIIMKYAHLLFSNLRPLQFNYFFGKEILSDSKKKERKSHHWCLMDKSGFEIFCQTPKKKKKKCKF